MYERPPLTVWRIENDTRIVLIDQVNRENALERLVITLSPKSYYPSIEQSNLDWLLSSELEILILTRLTKRHIAQLLEMRQ